MERRKFTREFKLEAVKLITERGVSYAQASRGSGRASDTAAQLGEGVCGRSAAGLSRPWADEARAGRDRAAEARGDQAQGRTRHPKKSRGLLREGERREVRLHREAPGNLAGGMDVRGARCLARWVLCLADATAQSRAAAATKSWARRYGRASLPATEPTAPGVCGTTCSRKGYRAGCIGSSG